MSIYEAIVSGIVQGLTEFLPVSSSGHLVLIHHFFGRAEPVLFFDCLMHLATMAAILVFFRAEVVRIFTVRRRWLWLIAAASVPVALAGFFLGGRIEQLFSSIRVVSIALMVTGLWLLGVDFFKDGGAARSVSLKNALLIGLAQATALIPGISRSGATIGAGILSGVRRNEAVAFSFLLSVPAILGATLVTGFRFNLASGGVSAPQAIAGMVSAFVVGLASLKALVFLIRERKLYLFGIYCMGVGWLSLVNG